ncbi:PaaI family thioesterase [Corynebacterium capitovis]|uniref:PaaI family thioesterase n=1 Tax=Corynebacterium capitovis TaxID=131081 RepID=UPI001B7F7C2F|nr:PaaI family thioesterase [Corynebacterium capitovis]
MTHRFGSEVLKTPLDAAELEQFNSLNTGLSRTLGIAVTHVSGDKVEGYLDVQPSHHQFTGIVNGGVYCSIGETLGSIAAVAAAGVPAVGMNNNTDLLSSVSEGRIDAVAVPVHVGRTTHLWRVEMRAGDKLLATTNLKLMILRPR